MVMYGLSLAVAYPLQSGPHVQAPAAAAVCAWRAEKGTWRDQKVIRMGLQLGVSQNKSFNFNRL